MTCVAALTTPSGTWMAGDSAAASETGVLTVTSTPKVGRVGGLLIGAAGNVAVLSQAVQRAKSMPSPSVRRLFADWRPKARGWWSLLLACDGAVWEVDADGLMNRQEKRQGYAYGAIGDGCHAALGALYVAHRTEDDLLWALEASAHHTTTVRRPFYSVGLD